MLRCLDRFSFWFAAPLAGIAITLLVVAGAALAQPGRGMPTKTFKVGGPDELWDVTMKMEMPGMAMPAQSFQSCLKKDRKGEDAIPKQDNCKTTDVKVVGNKTSFTIECTGKDPMTGRGEITATPTAYDGKMQIKSTGRGGEMEMTQIFSGKKVGACTDETEKVIASVQAQGAAEVAKACAEMSDKLYYQAFVDKGALCEAQRKPFCDKVGGMARDMREPAGFRTVLAKANVEAIQGSFQACKLDYPGIAKAACSKASAAKDWAFVGNGVCDDEVRAAGPTFCKGRDYYLVDRSLTSLCNRYARLTRGASGSADVAPADAAPTSGAGQATATGKAPPTAAKAPPEPAKADPLQQGVDALRKLLPF